jgi:hypothetical protein
MAVNNGQKISAKDKDVDTWSFNCATSYKGGWWYTASCNNVAPATNLCLGRATTWSHSSQWSKIKVAVET